MNHTSTRKEQEQKTVKVQMFYILPLLPLPLLLLLLLLLMMLFTCDRQLNAWYVIVQNNSHYDHCKISYSARHTFNKQKIKMKHQRENDVGREKILEKKKKEEEERNPSMTTLLSDSWEGVHWFPLKKKKNLLWSSRVWFGFSTLQVCLHWLEWGQG